MGKILKLSYIYIALSVLIGPAIIALSVGDHPSGLDCGDSSWGNTAMAIRVAYFDSVATRMTIGASVLIGVGIILLGLLLYAGITTQSKLKVIIPAFGIVFMLCGYALILSLAASGFC